MKSKQNALLTRLRKAVPPQRLPHAAPPITHAQELAVGGLAVRTDLKAGSLLTALLLAQQQAATSGGGT